MAGASRADAERLAAAACLPQSTVARIETGERKETLIQMKALAAALGIALDTLVATLD